MRRGWLSDCPGLEISEALDGSISLDDNMVIRFTIGDSGMRALYLYGGWPGHIPYEVAGEWGMPILSDLGFEVEQTQDPFRLEDSLEEFDLIVIGWTQALTTEDLTPKQEENLLRAVSAGTGLAGYHGMAASFRASLQYSFLVGGSFIEHPGGEAGRVPYDVTIVDTEHEITQGVGDFRVATEQYYMECDPNNHVLAETVFRGDHLPWIDGYRMPVAWTKTWGEGRVFYCAIGHFLEDLQNPDNTRLMRQGFEWASRARH